MVNDGIRLMVLNTHEKRRYISNTLPCIKHLKEYENVRTCFLETFLGTGLKNGICLESVSTEFEGGWDLFGNVFKHEEFSPKRTWLKHWKGSLVRQDMFQMRQNGETEPTTRNICLNLILAEKQCSSLSVSVRSISSESRH